MHGIHGSATAKTEQSPGIEGPSDLRHDAFISYSHQDREFALRLRTALQGHGKDVWLDESGIWPAERWKSALQRAIEGSDTFIFVISADSAASRECRTELDHAVSLNKRVIPVVASSVDRDTLPPGLGDFQFVPPRGTFEANFEASSGLLVSAIDTDLEWVREHTQWGLKAIEWDNHGRDASFLLAGSELEAAEQWLARQSGKRPEPTTLHNEFVLVSRRHVVRRLRRTRAFTAAALAIVSVLAVTAFVLRNQAVRQSQIATSRQLAAEATNLLPTDGPLAMLLSLQAYESAPTPQAESALIQASQQPLDYLLVAGRWIRNVAFSPDGHTLAAADALDDRGHIGLWDVATGRRIATLAEGSPVGSVAFSPDGHTLAAGDNGGHIGLWDLATARRAATLAEGGTVYSVAFSPDGHTLAASDFSGDVALWDVATALRTATLAEGNSVSSVAFSPDGHTLAAGDYGGEVGLWDVATGRRTATLAEGGGIVSSVAFSPDGHTLAAGDRGGEVGLWDVATGRRTATLAEGGPVYSVAFSPDGHTLAVGDNYVHIGLWEVATGQRTATLTETSGVRSVAFSPDGQTLVTGDYVGNVGIWSAVTRQQSANLAEGSTVASLAFSPHGHVLAIGGMNGNIVLLWQNLTNLTPRFFMHLICGKVRGNMTQAQWAQYAPGQPYQKTCPHMGAAFSV